MHSVVLIKKSREARASRADRVDLRRPASAAIPPFDPADPLWCGSARRRRGARSLAATRLEATADVYMARVRTAWGAQPLFVFAGGGLTALTNVRTALLIASTRARRHPAHPAAPLTCAV
ncbi:hypothetical protein MXD62_22035 [Frankia sp. Mgl5]|uniref:hypothetical protein n=1 Tax=Frankia sp. Mgl5 TaxID=2933793 RepID=UPI002010AC71|nr:hypothetical protein [Frankia sp. Mgl5]MCK9929817.1 hypothetical protein [Frankia sp. Mgl5]